IATLLTLVRPTSRTPLLARLAWLARQPLCLAVAVYFAIMAVTAVVGLDPRFSFWSNFERGEGVFQHFHYVIYFALLAALLDARDRWLTLLKLRAAVAAIVCLLTLARVEAVSAPPLVGRLSGPLGHPAYLAGYLVLEMCFAALLLLEARRTGRI